MCTMEVPPTTFKKKNWKGAILRNAGGRWLLNPVWLSVNYCSKTAQSQLPFSLCLGVKNEGLGGQMNIWNLVREKVACWKQFRMSE